MLIINLNVTLKILFLFRGLPIRSIYVGIQFVVKHFGVSFVRLILFQLNVGLLRAFSLSNAATI